MPEYVTPPIIAKTFGIAEEKVRSFIKKGQLPALDLSTGNQRPRYLISRKDLSLFIESRRVPSDVDNSA